MDRCWVRVVEQINSIYVSTLSTCYGMNKMVKAPYKLSIFCQILTVIRELYMTCMYTSWLMSRLDRLETLALTATFNAKKGHAWTFGSIHRLVSHGRANHTSSIVHHPAADRSIDRSIIVCWDVSDAITYSWWWEISSWRRPSLAETRVARSTCTR
jgi:hypothetical protein